jgi:hypothetical protein
MDKVFVIISQENNAGEESTNCEGVFSSRDKADKVLQSNINKLIKDADFPPQEYEKELTECENNFYCQIIDRINGEIVYTMYQIIVEKEVL